MGIEVRGGALPANIPWGAPIPTSTYNFVANMYVANLDLFKSDRYGIAYRLFLNIQATFVGKYSVKTTSNFVDYENDFYKFAWTMGELFITMIDGEFQYWEVVKIYNEGIKIKAVEARLLVESGYENVQRPTYYFINNLHGIYFRWGVTRLSAYFFWFPILQVLSKMIRATEISSDFDAKKMIRVINHTNKRILDEERHAYLDPENPFIDIYKKINNNSLDDKLDKEEKVLKTTQYIELKSESKTNQLWNNIENYTRYWWNSIGEAVPQQLRLSGKTDQESLADYYNSIGVEELTLRNLRNFAKKAKELWKVDLEFERTVDLKKVYMADDKNENKGEKDDE